MAQLCHLCCLFLLSNCILSLTALTTVFFSIASTMITSRLSSVIRNPVFHPCLFCSLLYLIYLLVLYLCHLYRQFETLALNTSFLCVLSFLSLRLHLIELYYVTLFCCKLLVVNFMCILTDFLLERVLYMCLLCPMFCSSFLPSLSFPLPIALLHSCYCFLSFSSP